MHQGRIISAVHSFLSDVSGIWFVKQAGGCWLVSSVLVAEATLYYMLAGRWLLRADQVGRIGGSVQ